jgi:hypothetical protein
MGRTGRFWYKTRIGIPPPNLIVFCSDARVESTGHQDLSRQMAAFALLSSKVKVWVQGGDQVCRRLEVWVSVLVALGVLVAAGLGIVFPVSKPVRRLCQPDGEWNGRTVFGF